jgi:hypothetical protein
VSDHLSPSQLERFCVSALKEDELAAVTMHVADCQSCHQQFTEELRHQRGPTPISLTLAPEFWFRHDHVDFAQLIGLAEKSLDAITREIVDIHLKVCGTCREDVRSFLAFRKQSARDMEVSYGPTGHASAREGFSELPWWRGFGWRPAYALAAVVLAAVALVIVGIVLKRRSDSLAAKKNEPTQINILASPTPTNNNPAGLPSPSRPEPSRSPDPTSRPTIDNPDAIAVLKDGRGEVTIGKSGRLTGLDDISSISRQEIAQAVLTERTETSEVLKTLGGQDSSLRGSNSGRSFRLLYPARRVIIENLPVFKWETVAGASRFQVFVLNSKGSEVARSEELPSTQTQWTAKTPLARGGTFSWVVTAVVDGKEIVSPAASAPEMKFAVLSTKDAQELTQLKKAGSHLALGVFYAKAGLLTEAEREFRRLVQLNPQSQIPGKLLRSVKSLHEPK